jgi:hypothetical protein
MIRSPGVKDAGSMQEAARADGTHGPLDANSITEMTQFVVTRCLQNFLEAGPSRRSVVVV